MEGREENGADEDRRESSEKEIGEARGCKGGEGEGGGQKECRQYRVEEEQGRCGFRWL